MRKCPIMSFCDYQYKWTSRGFVSFIKNSNMYSTLDLSYTSVWYGSLLFCVILCKFIEIRNYDKLYTTKLASNFLFN